MGQARRTRLAAQIAVALLVAGCAGSPSTPAPSRSGGSAVASASQPSGAPTSPAPGSSVPPPSAIASAGTAGCGVAGASACPTYQIGFARNIPFTPPVDCGGATQCQIQLDVYYPAPGSSGGPWPLIVAIPGGPEPLGGRAGLGSLAVSLAQQGAVVYTADYRSMPNQDAGFPQTFQDAACAISFARATAATYGGSPAKVTLVGGSLGGWVGAVVAFTPQPFPLSTSNCLQPAEDARPDAFVGVAGVYSFDQIDTGYLTGFFGGTQQAQPGAWAAGEPYTIVTNNRSETIPVRLVAGSRDTVGSAISQQTFAALLQAAGYSVTLTMIPGANHGQVFEAAQTVTTIISLARAER